MIVVGGWPGRNVIGLNGHFGVRPADFGVGGSDNPFLNDVDAGDTTTEFVAVVTGLPGSGTVTFGDDGGFSHIGAANGTYNTTFTLYTWPLGGPITQHTPAEVITTVVGPVTFSVSAGGLPSTLAMGSASFSFSGTSSFSVSASGLPSTISIGAANFAFSAPGAFAVSAVGVPSTLAIGQAAFNFVGVFTVPTPLYAARILDVPPDAMTSLIGFPMTVGWNKDVNETLDYGVDFTRVLALLTNDSIASYEVVADWDLNVLATTLRGNVVGVLVSGGRPGLISTISCRVTTVQGRVIEAPLYIQNIYR